VAYFVIQFNDCGESVIRYGDNELSVAYPDDLGCKPVSVRPVNNVKFSSIPWTKNGELRCEVE